MHSNKPFQIALIISLIAHTTLFFKLPPINLLRSRPNLDKKVQLTYVREKVKLPTLKISNQEFPKKPSRQTSSKVVAPPPHIKKEQIFTGLKNIPIIKPEFTKPEIIAVKKKITLAKLQDEKTANPVYFNYYQKIREKIKLAAYENYTRLVNGEVYLSFIILSNGQLRDIRINKEKSTNQAYLKEIAKKSIYEASPFPNFPKDLNYPELSFNVIISFEVE